jgi:hypothetical protein
VSAWPQFVVIAWLLLSVCSAVAAAVRARGWVVLTVDQQRVAAAGFAVAALSEASLLWAGGFFEGIF